jgi:phosphoribosylaminoimidazolecarboxamide formyltransferase / IMP cyclohydrolase
MNEHLMNYNFSCALTSVYDKTGIAKFAKSLTDCGYSIIATEGTGKVLSKNDIQFITADDVTQNPDYLRDCIQTISFRISSGILFNRSSKKHLHEIQDLNLCPIDIVVCNFPPIKETVHNPSEFNIQHVDLGGPLMVRAAAINYHFVLTIVDPSDYEVVSAAIKEGNISMELRKELAVKAFRYTSAYDETIIRYLNSIHETKL